MLLQPITGHNKQPLTLIFSPIEHFKVFREPHIHVFAMRNKGREEQEYQSPRRIDSPTEHHNEIHDVPPIAKVGACIQAKRDARWVGQPHMKLRASFWFISSLCTSNVPLLEIMQ